MKNDAPGIPPPVMTVEVAQELQKRYELSRRLHRERLGLTHTVGNRNG